MRKAPQTILFLTHVGEMGGAEGVMLTLAGAVQDRCRVCLFQDGPLKTQVQDAGLPCAVLTLPDSVSSFRRENGILKILKAVPGMIGFSRHLTRTIRTYDVTVCMSQKSFVLSALIKPFTRKPIIWFMNDLLTRDHFSGILIRFLITLSRFTADHVVLNAQASKQAWIDAGGKPDNITVLYPGIDTQNFNTALRASDTPTTVKQRYTKENTPLIGIFGRLSPWKGQDVFLRALARLENAHGLVVGGALFAEKTYEEELRTLVQELGLAHRVTFTGHSDDIPALMAACDVIAHCSTAPEPFGRVIVEGMLAGTPVIASDAGGAQEIIMHEQTGYLYPMGDDAQLAALITHCLTTHITADDPLITHARTVAHTRFSAQSLRDGFLALLKDISAR